MDHRPLALPLLLLSLTAEGLAHGGVCGPWVGPPPPQPSTAPPPAQDLPDLSVWSNWWEAHEHLILPARVIPSIGVLDGACPLGTGEEPDVLGAVAHELVRSKVIPALVSLEEQGGKGALVRAGILGRARTAWALEESERRALLAHLRKALASDTPGVAGAAALAIGIVDDGPTAGALLGIVRDDATGRTTADAEAGISAELRTQAAYALGLIGLRTHDRPQRLRIARTLLDLVLRPESAGVETRIAALHAASLLDLEWERPEGGGPGSSQGATLVSSLLEGLESADGTGPFQDFRLRAQVPVALARLLNVNRYARPEELVLVLGRSVDSLVALGNGARKERRVEVIQASVIALGLIGDAASGEGPEARASGRAFAALERLARTSAENQTEYLALIGLARLGSRPGPGDLPRGLQERAQKALLGALAKGRGQKKAWAALALGLFGRGVHEGDGVLSPAVTLSLRHAAKNARRPDDLAPIGLALGMLGDRSSAKRLLERSAALGPGSDALRSHLHVALGLLGAKDSLPALRASVGQGGPASVGAATGLSLLSSAESVAPLVGALGAAKDARSRTRLARAVARSGRPEAVEPLLGLLDDAVPVDVRADAAAALTALFAEGYERWSAPYAGGLNHRVDVPSLHAPKTGTGLLDLL